MKNDWPMGLKRMEKGSDHTLSMLARDDLLEPKDPSSRLALGKAWFDRAEKLSGLEQLALRQRGALWLAESLGGLDPVGRDWVLQRMELFQADVPCFRLCWQGREAPPGFVTARFNGKDQRGWVTLEGIWKFSGTIASDARDDKDMKDRFMRSTVMANWVYVLFEFKGGNPALYISSAPETFKGTGCNFDSVSSGLRIAIDMGRWNTVRYERAGETMKVYFNDQACHTFSPGPAGYILVKGQRGELRVRKLVAFGFNP